MSGIKFKKKSNSITSLTFDQIVARKKGNSLSLAVLKTVIFHHVVIAYSCIETTGSVVEIPVVSEAVVVIGSPTEIFNSFVPRHEKVFEYFCQQQSFCAYPQEAKDLKCTMDYC